MNQKCDQFIKGNKTARDKLNQLVNTANALGNIRGDNLIHVVSNGNGYSFTFDVQKLISMLPLRIGSGIGFAFCKTAAGAASSIVCYPGVDWGGTGTEPATITVYCTIAGGGYLNAAYPRLTDGLQIPVIQDGDTWRCLWGFQAADEDCEE